MNDYFKKSNIEKKITEAEIIIYRKYLHSMYNSQLFHRAIMQCSYLLLTVNVYGKAGA